jgi:hypothetical protein
LKAVKSSWNRLRKISGLRKEIWENEEDELVTLEIIFEKDIKFWFQNSVPVLFLNGQALTEIFS